MNDELTEALRKLIAQQNTIKQNMSNSTFILQYESNTIQLSEDSFLKLAQSIRYDTSIVMKEFKTLAEDEYIIAAYHDGKMIATKTNFK